MAQEKLLFNIPKDSSWHIEDVEAKAEELGFGNKSELLLFATNLIMGFDKTFIDRIKHLAKGLRIPESLVIQNYIIKEMATDQAKAETFGPHSKTLDQFLFVQDGDTHRVMTGDELLETLKQKYVSELKNSDSYKRRMKKSGGELADE